MTQEIELKLTVPESAISQVISFMDQQASSPSTQLLLKNSYYDTADQQLKNAKMALRVRETVQNGRSDYEMTFKSGGQSETGLHQRHELNIELPSAELDPVRWSWPESCAASMPELSELSVQFYTDFQRTAWLIQQGESLIEVVLDQGTIGTSQQHQTLPIREIELEIKQGHIADLLIFAQKLTRFPLSLFSQSKAQRGYQLLENKHGLRCPTVTFEWSTECRFELLNSFLVFWQQCDECALNVSSMTPADKALHKERQQMIAAQLNVWADSAFFTKKEAERIHAWCDEIEAIYQHDQGIKQAQSEMMIGLTTALKLQLLQYMHHIETH